MEENNCYEYSLTDYVLSRNSEKDLSIPYPRYFIQFDSSVDYVVIMYVSLTRASYILRGPGKYNKFSNTYVYKEKEVKSHTDLKKWQEVNYIGRVETPKLGFLMDLITKKEGV